MFDPQSHFPLPPPPRSPPLFDPYTLHHPEMSLHSPSALFSTLSAQDITLGSSLYLDHAPFNYGWQPFDLPKFAPRLDNATSLARLKLQRTKTHSEWDLHHGFGSVSGLNVALLPSLHPLWRDDSAGDNLLSADFRYPPPPPPRQDTPNAGNSGMNISLQAEKLRPNCIFGCCGGRTFNRKGDLKRH